MIRIFICLLTTSFVSIISADELRIEAFLASNKLDISGKEEVFKIIPSIEFYKTIQRRDLGDFRIFNGAGEIVPHILTLPDQDFLRASEENVSFVKIEQSNEATENIKVYEDSANNIIRAESSRFGRQESYLLDLRKIKLSFNSLKIEFSDLNLRTMIPIELLMSEDLVEWATISSGDSVGAVGGHSNPDWRPYVLFDPIRTNYLILTSLGENLLKPGNIVVGGLPYELSTGMLKSTIVQGLYEGSGKKTVMFDLGARLFMNGYRIHLPVKDTDLFYTLYSRHYPEDPWIKRDVSTAFRRSYNHIDLVSPIHKLYSGAPARYWKLESTSENLSEPPALEVFWCPVQISFYAKGPEPFILAYGSDKVKPPAFDQLESVLLARSKELNENIPIKEAFMVEVSHPTKEEVERSGQLIKFLRDYFFRW